MALLVLLSHSCGSPAFAATGIGTEPELLRVGRASMNEKGVLLWPWRIEVEFPGDMTCGYISTYSEVFGSYVMFESYCMEAPSFGPLLFRDSIVR